MPDNLRAVALCGTLGSRDEKSSSELPDRPDFDARTGHDGGAGDPIRVAESHVKFGVTTDASAPSTYRVGEAMQRTDSAEAGAKSGTTGAATKALAAHLAGLLVGAPHHGAA